MMCVLLAEWSRRRIQDLVFVESAGSNPAEDNNNLFCLFLFHLLKNARREPPAGVCFFLRFFRAGSAPALRCGCAVACVGVVLL